MQYFSFFELANAAENDSYDHTHPKEHYIGIYMRVVTSVFVFHWANASLQPFQLSSSGMLNYMEILEYLSSNTTHHRHKTRENEQNWSWTDLNQKFPGFPAQWSMTLCSTLEEGLEGLMFKGNGWENACFFSGYEKSAISFATQPRNSLYPVECKHTHTGFYLMKPFQVKKWILNIILPTYIFPLFSLCLFFYPYSRFCVLASFSFTF